MEAIPVPVINHILCVPMKFHFLCDVMRGKTSLKTDGQRDEHRQTDGDRQTDTHENISQYADDIQLFSLNDFTSRSSQITLRN